MSLILSILWQCLGTGSKVVAILLIDGFVSDPRKKLVFADLRLINFDKINLETTRNKIRHLIDCFFATLHEFFLALVHFLVVVHPFAVLIPAVLVS